MGKRWYAVTHGDDLDCGTGSHNKREAIKIANKMHRNYPGEQIRIVYCRDDSDFAEDVEIIHDGLD